jgi:hypothetical protein
MAADVSRFLKDQGLTSGVNLLGHSMYVVSYRDSNYSLP